MKHLIRTGVAIVIGGVLITGAAIYWRQPSAGNVAAKDAAGGEQHQEGGAIGLSDAKIAAAGIELVSAAPGTIRDSIFLNGIIQPNQEALVQVTPRFPGVVREIHKRIGERVEKGEVLARVESNQSLTVYQLVSPLGGTIIDRQVALGEHIGEQKPAFVIADLSSVWIDFSIFGGDLKRVRVGDQVTIDVGDGGPRIETKLFYISPVVNSDTQSALARVVVSNPESRLRPGLFVTARLLLSTKPVTVAIKATALQTVENRTVVFVRVGEKFEARDVELGNRDPENVEVTFGLLEGDVYAAKNSFVIKAEMAKGTASHEH